MNIDTNDLIKFDKKCSISSNKETKNDIEGAILHQPSVEDFVSDCIIDTDKNNE